MKRLIFTLFIVLFSYIIYYDLKVGTLLFIQPTYNIERPSIVVSKTVENEYIIEEVKQGDTVLSIVERLHQNSLPVTIETIVSDFESLNPNTTAHSIHVGQNYKFPIYK